MVYTHTCKVRGSCTPQRTTLRVRTSRHPAHRAHPHPNTTLALLSDDDDDEGSGDDGDGGRWVADGAGTDAVRHAGARQALSAYEAC